MTDPCVLPGDKRHYEVFSPEHEVHPGSPYGWSPEPPEYGCAWAVFEAESPAKAKAQAIRHPEFERWVEGRAPLSPFKGLKARLWRCRHKVCLGCAPGEFCADCLLESDVDLIDLYTSDPVSTTQS